MPTARHAAATAVLCPFDLRVQPIARFLNCELDDPVYDGLELQWFDDDVHGRGLLAFLSRRADRRVDFYHEPGLTLDPASFAIGAGVGAWTETGFGVAALDVADDGVAAEVAFADVARRAIEVRVDDRDGRRRRRAQLLAPVGDAIDDPQALLLVWLHGFDLARRTGAPPVVRIDGRPASTGRLPGRWLHRRELIKYAAPVSAAELNRRHDGPLDVVDPADPAPVELDTHGRLAAVTARHGAHHARFALSPSLPDLATLPPGRAHDGRWTIDVDGARLTGGAWTARRHGDAVDLTLDVTDRWRPRRLPPLMRVVTTVLPTFRRWPTTYRWVATVTLSPTPTMTARWERTSPQRGDAYHRATAPRGVQRGTLREDVP